MEITFPSNILDVVSTDIIQSITKCGGHIVGNTVRDLVFTSENTSHVWRANGGNYRISCYSPNTTQNNKFMGNLIVELTKNYSYSLVPASDELVLVIQNYDIEISILLSIPTHNFDIDLVTIQNCMIGMFCVKFTLICTTLDSVDLVKRIKLKRLSLIGDKCEIPEGYCLVSKEMNDDVYEEVKLIAEYSHLVNYNIIDNKYIINIPHSGTPKSFMDKLEKYSDYIFTTIGNEYIINNPKGRDIELRFSQSKKIKLLIFYHSWNIDNMKHLCNMLITYGGERFSHLYNTEGDLVIYSIETAVITNEYDTFYGEKIILPNGKVIKTIDYQPENVYSMTVLSENSVISNNGITELGGISDIMINSEWKAGVYDECKVNPDIRMKVLSDLVKVCGYLTEEIQGQNMNDKLPSSVVDTIKKLRISEDGELMYGDCKLMGCEN